MGETPALRQRPAWDNLMHLSKWMAFSVTVAMAAAGCEANPNWQKRQVPITTPKEQLSMDAPASAPAPSAAPAASRAPAVTTGAAPTATSRPASVSVAGKPIERPTRLTDLVGGGSAATTEAVSVPVDFQPAATPGPLAATATAATQPVAVAKPSPSPSAVPAARGELVATYGLQVNNRYITIEEILRAAASELAELPKNLEEAAFRRQAQRVIHDETRMQINNALIFPEAEWRLNDEQKKYIGTEMDKTLRALIAEAGGSRKKLEEVFAQRGTTLDEAMAEQRRKVTVTLFLQSKFYPAIVINRGMMLAYYRQNKASKYSTGRKVQMQLIAAPLAAFQPAGVRSDEALAAAKVEARKQIELAQAALAAGEEFGAVARKFSKGSNADSGGLYSMMAAGNFKDTKVEEAAFALEEGKVSGILETELGFYIVKAKAVQSSGEISFEQAQDEIEKALHREQYNKLYEKYISSKMESATITYSDRLEEIAVDKAVERYWKK